MATRWCSTACSRTPPTARCASTRPRHDDAPDPLAEPSLALAGITSAAVQGRSALGPRAGARVLQLGRMPGAPWVTTTSARQAHADGFDLHANVAVAANNRDGLEQLARYVLRPVNEGFRCSPLPALCPARLPARRPSRPSGSIRSVSRVADLPGCAVVTGSTARPRD